MTTLICYKGFRAGDCTCDICLHQSDDNPQCACQPCKHERGIKSGCCDCKVCVHVRKHNMQPDANEPWLVRHHSNILSPSESTAAAGTGASIPVVAVPKITQVTDGKTDPTKAVHIQASSAAYTAAITPTVEFAVATVVKAATGQVYQIKVVIRESYDDTDPIGGAFSRRSIWVTPDDSSKPKNLDFVDNECQFQTRSLGIHHNGTDVNGGRLRPFYEASHF
jgi:hypothetical protein